MYNSNRIIFYRYSGRYILFCHLTVYFHIAQEDTFSAVADDGGSAASGSLDQSAAGQVRVGSDGQDGHRQGGEERAAPGKVRGRN